MIDNATRRLVMEEEIREEEASLAGLQQQIQELLEKVHTLREEEKLLELHVARLRKRLAAVPSNGDAAGASPSPEHDTPEEEDEAQTPAAKPLKERIVDAMLDNGGPMRLFDITNAVRLDESTKRSSFQSSVATCLIRRDELFVNVSRGVYDLKDREQQMQKRAARRGKSNK